MDVILKKRYSKRGSITSIFMLCLIFFGLIFTLIFNPSFLALFFVPFILFFLWLFMYCFRVIVVTKEYLEISLFNKLLKIQQLNEVVEIYYSVNSSNKPITVLFSKVFIRPNKLSTNKKTNNVKNVVSIICSKKDLELLKNNISKNFVKV